MKKKALVISFACVLLAGGLVFAFASMGKRPYKKLDASEIFMAAVHLAPPDKTVLIPDIEELAQLLRDVVIYKQDNSYREYSGQGVIFTLTMTDGTQTDVMAYNPFLVIDGVGYKTKYKPCAALSSYANRLLREEDAVIVLDEPPWLAVVSGQTSTGAILGTYSWGRRNRDGTGTSFFADSTHPLALRDMMEPLDTTEATALLRFAEEPDAILSVRCWSDEHWGDLPAEGEEVAVHGNEIDLKPGAYIYEVTAKWDTERGYGGGTAQYSFFIFCGT